MSRKWLAIGVVEAPVQAVKRHSCNAACPTTCVVTLQLCYRPSASTSTAPGTSVEKQITTQQPRAGRPASPTMRYGA
jgi:hypothetical protein